MTEVIYTDEFGEWYDSLSDSDSLSVFESCKLLEQMGVRLGRPRSGTIEGSRYAFRELIVQSGGKPLRIYYAFDPRRNAVLLIGGDKTGRKRFYEEL